MTFPLSIFWATFATILAGRRFTRICEWKMCGNIVTQHFNQLQCERNSNMHLPFLFTSSWQSTPWNPDWHEHEMALSDVGTHVPPFKHFMYWHGFLSFSQFKPKYWGVQSHFLSPFSELHLPPFLQGEDSQGSEIKLSISCKAQHKIDFYGQWVQWYLAAGLQLAAALVTAITLWHVQAFSKFSPILMF